MTGRRPALPDAARARPSRRQLLVGGAAASLGALAGAGGERIRADARASTATAGAERALAAARVETGAGVVPFHGEHQAGVATTPQAFATLLAFDLRAETDRDRLARLLRILSDDVERLAAGRAPLADTEPELAAVPASLSVTFAFGPGLVARAGAAGSAPAWLRPLPAFGVDRLEERWSGGDLLLQVCADDPVTVSHAVRMLAKDARAFATPRWTQSGFRRARGAEASGTTMRNLFGQVDGTANPRPGDEAFDALTWIASGPFAGGTGMVVRRIEMDLDAWDRVDRSGREQSTGRTLDTGAPLTGAHEYDEPDFEARTEQGFEVIPAFSHVRRSRADDPRQRIVRRVYNYEEPASAAADASAGLVFVSFQADVDAQFVPIQRRLDELDLLNEWTTPIGSAVFVVPPGCAPGGFVGETILG